jgi:hypothetical protein
MKKEALYLLRLPMFNDNGSLSTCLKFGYSSNIDKRMRQYGDYHPKFYILKKYEGGTQEDETRVKIYLKKYLIHHREFFKDCQEVLDFFKTNDTLDKIREVTSYITTSNEKERMKGSRVYFWPYISCIQEVVREVDTSLLLKDMTRLCEKKEDLVLEFIKVRYPIEFPQILQEYEKWKKIDPRLTEFIIRLQDTSILISKRLQLLCESQDFTDEEKKIIARQASESFNKYYNVLGPERCKACGYNPTDMMREIEYLLISKDDIKEVFLSSFEVGKRYTNVETKGKVRKIYQDLNINKSPKAVDVKEFFSIKKAQIIMPDKTKVNGLEILEVL